MNAAPSARPVRDAVRRYEAARRSGDALARAAAADVLAETCWDASRPWYDAPGVRGAACVGGSFAALAGWVVFLARLPLDALPWAALTAAGVLAARWGWQGWPDDGGGPP